MVLKSWLGLREVEDWERKLDVEEELQVEEVDRLFRERSNRIILSTQIYQIFLALDLQVLPSNM